MGDVPAVGFHVEPRRDDETRWLETALHDGELLVAWLAVSKVSRPEGRGGRAAKARWRFLVTTDRAALVGFPTKGADFLPVELWELPSGVRPLHDRSFGRAQIEVGGWRFRSKTTNTWAFGDVVALLPLSGRERRREAARINWMRGGKSASALTFASSLLASSKDLLDQLALILLGDAARRDSGDVADDQGQIGAVLQAVGRSRGGGEALARWAREWQLTPDEQMTLVRRLVEACGEGEGAEDAHRAALPLHRQARAALLPFEKELAAVALLDIGLASNLVGAGEWRDAETLIEERLANLPDETLMDLLPAKDLDLTTEGAQAVRTRLLELLVEARASGGAVDLESVTELARLQPLGVARIRALRGIADGDLAARAGVLESLFAPAGLAEGEAGEVGEALDLQPLPSADLEADIPHPASKEGGAFDRLHAWLGKAKAPDHKAIRSYAERASPRSFPGLVGALADGSLLLGAPAVDAYISRGERGIGIRAYEGHPPFVLIGYQHLEEGSEVFLRPEALLFAVTAELAHIRFKHTRLTSSEVWDGAFHKGSHLLDFVGAFSGPLGFLGRAAASLRRLAAVQAVIRHAQTVTTGASKAREVVGYATGIRKKAGKGGKRAITSDLEIGDRESELLAACRLLQLTADRAGLIVCGDPRAATEAIFLTSGDYRSELEMARRHGLTKTLGRRGAEGELVNQNLALRLAALYSFYLSEGYERLRAAAIGLDAPKGG